MRRPGAEMRRTGATFRRAPVSSFLVPWCLYFPTTIVILVPPFSSPKHGHIFGPIFKPPFNAWLWSKECAQILDTKLGPPNLKLHCRPSHVHTHFLDQNTVSFCSSFLILHFGICPQWHGPMPIMRIRTKEKPSTTATTKASQYSKALRTTLGGQQGKH